MIHQSCQLFGLAKELQSDIEIIQKRKEESESIFCLFVLRENILSNLKWWKNNLGFTVNTIRTNDFSVEIYTDASDSRWGADLGQKLLSKNIKELLNVKLALTNLACNLENCQILLGVDNNIASSCMNKMGGTQFNKYNNFAKEIWK